MRGAIVIALFGGCGAEERPESTTANVDTEGGVTNVDSLGPGSSVETEAPATSGVVSESANPETITAGCGEVSVEVEPGETPTLVLLVDRSSSMADAFERTDRWTAIYETLMGDDGVVRRLAPQVRFGLTTYSSRNGDRGGECPMLDAVAPALDNFEAMNELLEEAELIEDTPTGDSLDAVAETLAALDVDGPKGVILATDGFPDSCETPDPEYPDQAGLPAMELSLEAAERTFDLGVQTFIISVGPTISDEHLQEMANVGVGKPREASNPAPYYKALNPAELIDAFDDIVGSFVDCRFTIDGEVDVTQACDGTVALDGNALQCEEDWRVVDSTTLELVGSACETLQAGGEHAISASWPCGVVTPIP